ncbi:MULTISPECIES: hypothetical protein [Planktothricoides]|nr:MULTISPECIES: hypothetical protein [Planktothricoides]
MINCLADFMEKSLIIDKKIIKFLSGLSKLPIAMPQQEDLLIA